MDGDKHRPNLFTMHTVAFHIEFTWFLLHVVKGKLLEVGEMCLGGDFIGEKLDEAEGMRGIGLSWIDRGEGGVDGVGRVVGFIGDED